MWCRTVDPLVDVLTDRGVEATVTFGEAADAQIAVAAGYSRGRNIGQLQLRRRGPAAAARDRWIVAAAEDAAQILASKGEIDARRAAAMPAEAAHLRQETRDRSILRQVAADQAPVASSRLNTRAVPPKSQLAAISIDTGAGSRVPAPSVAKPTIVAGCERQAATMPAARANRVDRRKLRRSMVRLFS